MPARLDKRLVVVIALVAVGASALVLLVKHRSRGARAPLQTFDYRPLPNVRPGGVPVRSMDNDIFAAIENDHLTRDQLLDLFPDRPYHVKLVANGEDHRVQYVLVDLHRSQTWNERWELKPEGVFRYTKGGAPESPPDVMFTLRAGYWIPH